jgi:hypothetical protein
LAVDPGEDLPVLDDVLAFSALAYFALRPAALYFSLDYDIL